MRYICAFRFDLRERYVEADAIQYLKEGFWINKDHKFTLGEDCKFWIPPSQIMYIKKEN